MTLDDRLDEFAFNGYTKMGLTDKQYSRQLDPAKEAILSDLLEIIGEDDKLYDKEGGLVTGENHARTFKNQLRQELRQKAREYCE